MEQNTLNSFEEDPMPPHQKAENVIIFILIEKGKLPKNSGLPNIVNIF